MPLTVRDGALLAAGMWFAGASTFFYRRKQTLPFKVCVYWCNLLNFLLTIFFSLLFLLVVYHHWDYTTQVAYFLSWPTLGSAVILVMTPSEDKMKKVSRTVLLNHPPCNRHDSCMKFQLTYTCLLSQSVRALRHMRHLI